MAIVSDHSPIIFISYQVVRRNKRGFRFEEMWLENPKCKEVIRESWGGNHTTDRDQIPWPKLGSCLRELIYWSKRSFDHNMVEIRKSKNRLKALGQNRPSQATQEEEMSLQYRIRELWKR